MFVVLLGLPGAGKGTQAARLKEDLGLPHVTTGDLVPNELTIGMLLGRIDQPDCANGCMFDGYPRNMEQAVALDMALAAAGKQVDRAVYVEVAEDELVRRLSGRWLCPKCAAIYQEVSAPPAKAGVCDKCDSELTQRSDDKPEVVRNRLKVNIENIQSLVDYYAGQDKLTTVDGGRDPEAVAADLRKALEG